MATVCKYEQELLLYKQDVEFLLFTHVGMESWNGRRYNNNKKKMAAHEFVDFTFEVY